MKTVTVKLVPDETIVFTSADFEADGSGQLRVIDLESKNVIGLYPSGCWRGVHRAEMPDSKPQTEGEANEDLAYAASGGAGNVRGLGQ